MKKIRYSKDVDALLVELSDDAIAYAEDNEQVILHYADDERLVLIEILDITQLTSTDEADTLPAKSEKVIRFICSQPLPTDRSTEWNNPDAE